MPGPYNSWLYIRDRSGLAFELINGARTKAYLSNPALQVPGIDGCQPFTGLACATWPYKPYLGATIPGSVTIPNTAGNQYLWSPDNSSVDIVGDISIVAKVAPTSWASGSVQNLVSKYPWSTGTTDFSWAFRLSATGVLLFVWSTNGTAGLQTTSLAAVPGVVAGQAKWVAVTYDVDNGAGGSTTRFFWSNNGINWNIIVSAQVLGGTSSIFSGASPIRVGSQGNQLPLVGTVYDAIVYSGIGVGGVPGGTQVYRFSAENIVDTTALDVPASSSALSQASSIITPNLTLQKHSTATPGFARFPPVAGNYLSTPDAAALDVVGDITLVARIRPRATKPTTSQYFASKYNATGSQESWAFGLSNTGLLIWVWSANGSVTTTVFSTVAPTWGVDGWLWVAVTHDVDNAAVGNDVRFWTSTNGSTWTQLGTTVTTAAVTSIFNSTAVLELSGVTLGTSSMFDGDMSRFEIGNGIGAGGSVGGTLAFRFDAVNITSSTATTITPSVGGVLTVTKTATAGPTVTAATLCGDWQTQTFNTPTADPAPWYNSAYPQSADALGFVVQDWTGLDDGHIVRASTPWGGYGGGSTLAQVAAAGRVMKINLYLYGRSEEAVEYLFRWLGAALAGVCSSCATETMLIRRYCGSTANLWDGVAEMRNVGLIEGLKWEAEIQPEGNRYVRTASFALMAGDPCMYTQDLPVTADGSDLSPVSLNACFAASVPMSTRVICRPSCSEIDSACRLTRAFTVNPLGAAAPIVTWTNSMSQYSFPFRAVAYTDPGLVGPANPCGLPVLGELYVRPLPAGASLRWDVVGRSVDYRDETTGGWTSGWAYIEPNDPPKQRFFAVPCGKGYVVMEPASLCATFVSGTTWTLDGISYNPPTYPTTSVSIGERLSCP